MSGGNKFAQDAPMTESESIADLERKFEVIRQRIQAYDKICSEFVQLNSRLLELETKPAEILRRIGKNEAQLDAFEQTLSVRSDTFMLSLHNLAEKFEHFDQSLAQNIRETAERYSSILDIVQQSEERSRAAVVSLAQEADLQTHKMSTLETFNTLQEMVKSQASVAEEAKSSCEFIRAEVKTKIGEIEENSKAIQRVNIFMNKFEPKMYRQIEIYLEEGRKEQAKFYDTLKKELIEMENRIMGTPNSNSSVEVRILNRLEMITLDAANALMLNRNSETKIKLLEKKIESLNLLLEKYELKS